MDLVLKLLHFRGIVSTRQTSLLLLENFTKGTMILKLNNVLMNTESRWWWLFLFLSYFRWRCIYKRLFPPQCLLGKSGRNSINWIYEVSICPVPISSFWIISPLVVGSFKKLLKKLTSWMVKWRAQEFLSPIISCDSTANPGKLTAWFT